MARHRKPPSQTWQTFLTNHAKNFASADFFLVPTMAFQLLFVFLILDHDRRLPLHFAVTPTPLRNGLRGNFSKLSPGIAHHGICSVTAMEYTDTSFPRRPKGSAFTKFLLRLAALGKTPMSRG